MQNDMDNFFMQLVLAMFQETNFSGNGNAFISEKGKGNGKQQEALTKHAKHTVEANVNVILSSGNEMT